MKNFKLLGKNYLEIVPVAPVKYCKQYGGPAANSDPQAYWVIWKKQTFYNGELKFNLVSKTFIGEKADF